MWGAISKIFTKTNNSAPGADIQTADMDRGENRRPDMDVQDSYDTRQVGRFRLLFRYM